MVQFYFLAIFVNLIGGLYFANEIFAKKCPAVVNIAEFFENETPKLVFAIVAGITGLFKIISSCDVPVAGDIITAISCFAICLYFISDIRSKKASAETPVSESAEPVQTEAAAEVNPAESAETAGSTAETAAKETAEKKAAAKVQPILDNYYKSVNKCKSALGIAAIILSVLHFLFPGVILI